uniref:Uncharacterized protein n=1 Tax=Rhizophora mucronata TaxID=61149 RepID=A0A2P2QNC0_RHIMU
MMGKAHKTPVFASELDASHDRYVAVAGTDCLTDC